MKNLCFIFIFFILCLPAGADTIKRDVKPNRTSGVYISATYNKSTCLQGALPNFKLVKEPQHGRVTFKNGQFKLGKKAGKCAGRRMKGTAIYYTPNRGFRGEDTFVARFIMQTYVGRARTRNVSHTFKISVK